MSLWLTADSFFSLEVGKYRSCRPAGCRPTVSVCDVKKKWKDILHFSIDKALETKTGMISGKFSSLLEVYEHFSTVFIQQHFVDFTLCAQHVSSFKNGNVKNHIASHFLYEEELKISYAN